MNKVIKSLVLVSMATILLSLSGCLFFALSVSGSVVNVQAPQTQTDFFKSDDGSSTLVGATITLTNMEDDSIVSGVVDGNGAYAIAGVSPGRYLIEGDRSGWVFVPRVVDISGFLTTLPAMLAYETPADLDQVLIMVEWSNIADDVDSYVARDTSDNQQIDGTIVCDYTDPTGDSFVQLDRDVTENTDSDIPRVETVRVISNSGAAYERLRYYLRLFNQADGGSLTGDGTVAPSNATVFVMQGTTHLGTFPIAYASAEQVVGVVAMEWDGAQWLIGSYGGAWLNGSGTGTTGIKSIANAAVPVKEMK